MTTETESQPIHTFADIPSDFKYNKDSFQLYFALLRLYMYCPCACFEFMKQLPYLEENKFILLLEKRAKLATPPTPTSGVQLNPDDVSFGIVDIATNSMLSVGGYRYNTIATGGGGHEDGMYGVGSTHTTRRQPPPPTTRPPPPPPTTRPPPPTTRPLIVARVFPPEEDVMLIMYLFELTGLLFLQYQTPTETPIETPNEYYIKLQAHVKTLEQISANKQADKLVCMDVAYKVLQYIKNI
jgi:hypothetical protein